MQEAYDCDVAVVGGGPVGLTLALSLTQARFRCAQLDSIALERVRIHNYTHTLLVGRGAVRMSFTKESVLSCPRGAFPGPGANDATAGLLAHRSALPAAFPGQDAPVDRLAISSRLTVAGTAPDLHRSSLFCPGWGTVCGGACPEPGWVSIAAAGCHGRAVLGGAGLCRSVSAVIAAFAGRLHPEGDSLRNRALRSGCLRDGVVF